MTVATDEPGSGPGHQPPPAWPELTNREAQVASMLAVGATCAEIAEIVGISQKTIDTHRGHVLKKLRLPHAVALAREALRRGAVTLEVSSYEASSKTSHE